MRPALAVLACPLAALLAGCGTSRPTPPDPTLPARPAAPQTQSFPKAGLRFDAPRNWRTQPGAAPLIATVSSGAAIVAVWRYPRTEPLPSTDAALKSAQRRLIAQARARDRTLRLVSAGVLRVDRAPAIALLARETIGGQPRLVRSTHVFAHGAEIVLDAYAPAATFGAVNSKVFAPLIASVRLASPRA